MENNPLLDISRISGKRGSKKSEEIANKYLNEMFRQKGVNCFSAGGKSNIIRQLEQSQNEEGTILVIVDGAAFGSEMKDISECIKTQGNIVLYAPESFEWLLLSTKEILEVNVETVLQNPEMVAKLTTINNC